MIPRRRQCRVPTILFWVGTRHCLGLYHTDATGNDMMIHDYQQLPTAHCQLPIVNYQLNCPIPVAFD